MEARHKRNIFLVLFIIFMWILFTMYMFGCSMAAYKFQDSADYADLTYQWMKANYPEWEVLEAKDYVYVLIDHEGGVYYIECFHDKDMLPTLQKQLK